MSERGELAKTYDPSEVEGEMSALWERNGCFAAMPDDRPRDRRFVVMIPLPNVTGALHLGHAINNTLQDVQTRYHRMRGDNTLWQPGTDHAGIATQAVVERRIFETEGKSRHDLGREEMVRRIWAWKDQYEARILGQLKQMGCSCDWDRTRFTLDEVCAKAVRECFFRWFKDGLIYRGKRLVNWDTQLQTAVADDEVYHETVKGHFWHFKYPVIAPKPGEPAHVIIATTRPETMLADTAVAVNPDPEGELNKREEKLRAELGSASGKERAEIQSRLERIAERRASHLPLLVTLRNMALDGRKVMLPLVDRPIPLVCDEHADPELGTGCVKITPAHDHNDFEVGLRHDLAPGRPGKDMISVMTPDGRVALIIEPDGTQNPNSDNYAGLAFATDGRKKVVADLEALGLVDHVEDRDIDLGHSDRSKTPIEPYLSDQWFVRMGDISEPQTSVCADQDDPQTSVCADLPKEGRPPRRPTPDLSAGAVLVTWTAYGTWLPGDERGLVSRIPEPGGGHVIHNLPGEPYDQDEPAVRNEALERMEGEPVRLNADQARVLLRSIAASAERHAFELLAVAIMPDHAHVLCQTDRVGGDILKLFKGAASRALNERFELSGAPRWFTRRGSTRFIKQREDLTAAIEYVQAQENPLIAWSFDADSGKAVEIVEDARAVEDRASARTEVRGSQGITLADGTKAPGLAQAAIDAVTSGRVKIFPERYTKTYLDWLSEKRDWCISRQLWWGHRVPVWSTSAPLPSQISDAAVYKLVADSEDISWTGFEIKAEWQEHIAGQSRVDGTTRIGTAYFCIAPGNPQIEESLESAGFVRDDDVLDTWFSSQLWPFSTLGWPEQGVKTDRDVDYYYPGSVLITSRDIITLWVARMVLSGLYCVGDVPFRHVYIHTKILDARGDTMSKSKGNGVDPVDIIRMYGADALRYTIADMATETQDVRMPVDYLCPHCGHLTPQTAVVPHNKRPAEISKAKCKGCKKEFATQWASDDIKQEFPVALETSDKFELGRNFSNKLWNAARFAFMNLEGAPCDQIDVASLPAEDRWILAELSDVVRQTNRQLQTYQFAQCIKDLREFFWDSVCDWYIELTKARMTGGSSEPRASARADQSGGTAKQVLAFVLDQVLRLLHPFMPYITERLWQQLNAVAPKRGLPGVADPEMHELLVMAQFPPDEGWTALDDPEIQTVFEDLQAATRAVRDLRSKCGVPPRNKVTVTLNAPAEHVEALREDASIIQRLANVEQFTVSTDEKRPANAAIMVVGPLQIFVHDISDDAKEAARLSKQIAETQKQVDSSKKRLSNEKFVQNADPEFVQAARDRLAELEATLQTLQETAALLK